jgi:hypothetical protein
MQSFSRAIADRLEAAASIRPVHVAPVRRVADNKKRMEVRSPATVVGRAHAQTVEITG